MIYAQFFVPMRTAVKNEAGVYTGEFLVSSTEFQEATGDRSVIILDGREKRQTHLKLAAKEMTKRGYRAFQLFQGEAFTRSVAVSTLYTE